jgi:hypothetical protein
LDYWDFGFDQHLVFKEKLNDMETTFLPIHDEAVRGTYTVSLSSPNQLDVTHHSHDEGNKTGFPNTAL